MTSAIETAITELSANLRRMEQRHQATGYKFDRLYGLIAAAREELGELTAPVELPSPEVPCAAPVLRAMATNYPAGHLWDKMDAQTCLHAANEIDRLRALLEREQ